MFKNHANKKTSLYKCLFKGCKPKTNKDGTPKYLKIKNDSRGNGTSHYLVNYCYLNYRMQILYWFLFHYAQYPNMDIKKYEEIWKLAVANMTSKDNIAIIHYSRTHTKFGNTASVFPGFNTAACGPTCFQFFGRKTKNIL